MYISADADVDIHQDFSCHARLLSIFTHFIISCMMFSNKMLSRTCDRGFIDGHPLTLITATLPQLCAFRVHCYDRAVSDRVIHFNEVE